MVYLVAFVVWCVIAIFAMNNRFLRDNMYGPRVGVAVANAVGIVLQVVFILAITYLFLTWLPGGAPRWALWPIGVAWVVLTLAFDFGVYPYAARARWTLLAPEYNPARGGLWALALLAELVGPAWVGAWVLGG